GSSGWGGRAPDLARGGPGTLQESSASVVARTSLILPGLRQEGRSVCHSHFNSPVSRRRLVTLPERGTRLSPPYLPGVDPPFVRIGMFSSTSVIRGSEYTPKASARVPRTPFTLFIASSIGMSSA